MYFSFKLTPLRYLYNVLTLIASFHLNAASLFHKKIALGVKGRQQTATILSSKISRNDKTIWFHCASLGEYEQGLPVFRIIKSMYPEHKIVLTFFSPSGYVIKKKNPITEIVTYLPLDTQQNASEFLDIVNPQLVVFVKYEIWPNYLNELHKRSNKAILISAVFRKNQHLFKPIGAWIQRSLFCFDHIFVQNKKSKALLESIGYRNATISGDTRFDRVIEQLNMDNTLSYIDAFKGSNICFVGGSTWPEDDSLFIEYIKSDRSDTKFIIVPHEIKTDYVLKLKDKLHHNAVLFSEKDMFDLSKSKVLIIDTIGLLSKIYFYADIAYIGGAMGNSGLHNILEAAVFGAPIIIGPNYDKFPEAVEFVNAQGVLVASDQSTFNSLGTQLIEDHDFRKKTGQINSALVKSNAGAVSHIASYLNKY